jgi:DNA-binding beta-propeller fold protein YncE
VFSISAGGQLTPVGSYGSGSSPFSVAFSRDGGLLATANSGNNTVSTFMVSAGGGLTPVGSYGTGSYPISVAFSADGGLLATANLFDNTVSVFSVSAGGGLTQFGSPIATGIHPRSVAFSPDAGLLATANAGDSTLSMFAGGDPAAQITAPADQQTYTQNQTVATHFACTTPTGAGAISSCTDSNGTTSPTVTLDTSILGAHSYTVTAASDDALSSSTTIQYTVTSAPPTTTTTTNTLVTTPTPTTTPTPPTATAAATIGQISLTSHTITWCSGCKYPGARLLFTLSRTTTIRLVLTADSDSKWHQIATTLLHAHAINNRYRLAGRWHGHLVPARHLRLLVQLLNSARWTTRATISLTIHSPFTTVPQHRS